MTCTLHEPCTFADLVEVVERATHVQLAMFRAQLAAGTSFAVRSGWGVAIACGGYVPLDDGRVEAWFAVNEVEGGKAMREVVRAITLTLQRVPYPEVHVMAGTRAGMRIARMAGFRPETGKGEPHEDDRKHVWRRQGQGLGPAKGRGRSQPAPGLGPDVA